MLGDKNSAIRSNWTREEVSRVFETPLLDLVHLAATIHRAHHNPKEVQLCTLLSIKTGACPEDCAYCPQSAHHKSEVKLEKLLPLEQVLQRAVEARASGATRLCMGAAWREVKNNADFERVLEMVKGVSDQGLEVCCTLGMLTEEQALRLKQAGLYAYNHNLDTSENFYSEIITTRTYQERLETLRNVRKAGLTVCCGGIIGMGETADDRIDLLHTLCTLTPHPDSVPVNTLVPVKGTPLEAQEPVAPLELVRMIACARILMPRSFVRLSAGRLELSMEAQALCFLAGANSIFMGDKLLTTANPLAAHDQQMLSELGLRGMAPENGSAAYGVNQ